MDAVNLTLGLSPPGEDLLDEFFPFRKFFFVLVHRVFGFEIGFLELLIDQRLDIVSRRTEATLDDELLAFFGVEVVNEEQRRMWVRRFCENTGVTDVGDNGIERAPFYRSSFALGDENI